MTLQHRLDGWWRGSQDKRTSVVSFTESTDSGAMKYSLSVFNNESIDENRGTREVYSEAGYLKGDQLSIATSDGLAQVMKCKSTWGRDEGSLMCSEGETSRQFLVSKYSMQFITQPNGQSPVSLNKDNVSWKNL
eukprot:TRINITY_DN27520_c0_g1_i1.p1 TRINITY_DN27520_c0_g1~~TRINITY_DN27520_c0_g1_i1.p1  ORF type:complete len:146 (+),score=30.29 TRINITY_DN27520_c0_g1_i1:38-439(+)